MSLFTSGLQRYNSGLNIANGPSILSFEPYKRNALVVLWLFVRRSISFYMRCRFSQTQTLFLNACKIFRISVQLCNTAFMTMSQSITQPIGASRLQVWHKREAMLLVASKVTSIVYVTWYHYLSGRFVLWAFYVLTCFHKFDRQLAMQIMQ